jgi:hypothetical protein
MAKEYVSSISPVGTILELLAKSLGWFDRSPLELFSLPVPGGNCQAKRD